jgi:hypothetical protein
MQRLVGAVSVRPRVLIAVCALLAAGVGVFAYLFAQTADEGTHANAARLDARMQRTSVRFHVALRDRLAREGAPFAARLERAANERDEAQRLAHSILDDLERHTPTAIDEPVLRHFGGPELSPAMDRLHLVLAMLWSERHPERARRIPQYALLHEARALEPTQLAAPYAELARAAQAYAHASGGYCDFVEPMSEGAPASLDATAMMDEIGDADPEVAALRLHRLQRFLVDGSLACCAMRNDRMAETAERLQQSIADAESLGICDKRLPLLRAWTAVLNGEDEEARRQLGLLPPPEELHDDDHEAYRIIRSALATGGARAASRAHVGTTRVEWLSRLVVAGALEAVEGSELAGPLRTSEAARAAQRLVCGEAAVIDAARRIEPFFDQGS